MTAFSLIICIVPHDRGEKLTKAAVKAGCGGGSVLMGRSLAKSNFAAVLGTGESTKDLIYTVVESFKKSSIIKAICDASKNEKPNFGELFTIEVDSLVRAGNASENPENPDSKGEEKMNENENNAGAERSQSRDMITVIVNKGYADDVMFAARKAGATGGTVINARGTAREDDVKFFVMHIVPEKEMLMIVTEHEKKAAVIEAIRTLPCLEQTGSGITFSAGVENFTVLGKN